MAKARKPASRAKRRTRTTAKRNRRRPFRVGSLLLSWLLLVVVGLGAALAVYGLHLDSLVRDKFEGQRWALPARVWAQPLELYVGRPLTAEQLRAELDRLHYRPVAAPERPGTYAMRDDRILVRTRPFRFWDGAEADRYLSVRFADGKISRLADAGDGRDVALARLDAALIASIYPTHNEDRNLVRRADLPDLLVQTLLVVEDRGFYEHFGLDLRAIIRAAVRNVQAGGVVEGASTLTQQLVKNFYLTQDRTLERKLKEAYMAVLLERRYSKDEILEAYVNEIFLGQDRSRAIHGFGLAARFYFNSSLDELGIPETAMLVGLIQGPSRYDPRRFPERALQRRNLVIELMAEYGVISRAEADQAKQATLGLREGGGRPTGDYPAFLQLVRRQLQRDYRDEDLRSEGLNIFTTLDPVIQSELESATRERMPALDRGRSFPVGTLETAAVVTSVFQAEVLAMVGGRDPSFAGFNRALDAVRPIGSLVKPAIYLDALSRPERYTLVSTLSDRPVSLIAGDGKRWEPKNFDRKVYGSVELYDALARSLNLATVNLGLDLGVREVARTLANLGVARSFPVVPAVLLGSVSLTPLEVAQAYHTLANGGFRSPLRAIREVVDAEGRPLNRYPLAVEAVADPQAVYLTTWAMRKVIEQGTARSLSQRLPAGLTMAGKTGTTDGLRDSWFAGFSGDKVAVVWVGRDDNQPAGYTGGSGALVLWGDVMTRIDNEPLPDFAPEGIQLVQVVCGRTMMVPFKQGSTRMSCGRHRPQGGPDDETAAVAESPPSAADDGSAATRSSRRADRGDNFFLPGF
ncbi:penicillin-binding protein 1B [Thioalkalicoccus limnaeus]|uniref:Penicillin-binding protein 1B n=1 Tax=Thioalkalicoccus limnaeus TaxID=120681 RepID=A0ABV4BGI1_9GAMM